MRSPRSGDIVRVIFWDHMEDHDEPSVCEAYGRVFSVSPRALVVDSWADPSREVKVSLGVEHQKDCERGDSDLKTFCILRRLIESVQLLKPAEELRA